MRSVTYSMGVSLDGYIAGPDGAFGWTAPDDEVFRFVTDEIREVGVHLLGRRLYETMLYWESADQDPSIDDSMREWAEIWTALPKVVFSTTLSAVQGNARLASGGLADEVERMRAETTQGNIAIGSATLAAEAAALGLVDEYRARVYPVLVGGGIPFFPSAGAGRISNLSRPAHSPRKSSTSGTACRARPARAPSPEKQVRSGTTPPIAVLSSRNDRSSSWARAPPSSLQAAENQEPVLGSRSSLGH